MSAGLAVALALVLRPLAVEWRLLPRVKLLPRES